MTHGGANRDKGILYEDQSGAGLGLLCEDQGGAGLEGKMLLINVIG